MPTPPLTEQQLRAALDAYEAKGNLREAAESLNLPDNTFRSRLKRARQEFGIEPMRKLREVGYDLARAEMTPAEAWATGAEAFERTVSDAISKQWQVIRRPAGPVCIAHFTDEHIDDNGCPLRLLEADIRASHDLGAVMCHGGDLLNNWPLAGRLAKQWAEQDCSRPVALLRAQHFIEIFKPDVWIDGNHEEMNPYLADLFKEWLPKSTIRDYWAVNFRIETPDGRPVRAIMSHKFQKGSSWFHKVHGHIREMLEGQEADLLMDGHVHSDGVLDHTLPERGHSAVAVASAGYKFVDKYARRISRGGLPKIRGRAHWIVADTQAGADENFITAFKSPQHAEAFMSGLQNLRAV